MEGTMLEGLKQYGKLPLWVSKDGKIYNTQTNKFMTHRKTRTGYIKTDACTHDNKAGYVHRMIALVYLPNPNNYKEVHHIDNDKMNNNVNNLEWVSKSQNCRMYTKKKSNGLPRGVSWNKVAKKYQTQMSINCKVTHLGYYTSIEEAHNVYLQKYEEIMGKKCIY